MIATTATPIVTSAYPVWMPVAWSQWHIREVTGARHNPQIIEYHRSTRLKATSDEIAWCSSFVNWVFQQVNVERTESAAARDWLQWGIAIDEPVYGALVIFDRSTRLRPRGGHVGFAVGRSSSNRVAVYGGNQKNEVCVDVYDTKPVLGYRWPA